MRWRNPTGTAPGFSPCAISSGENARSGGPFLCAVLAALALAGNGCGNPGAPAPPSLNLPTPIQNLSAARTADSVELRWTMPTRTTDRVTLKHSVRVQVCRTLQAGACQPVASLSLQPGKPASYTDMLPPDLTQGPPRLLTYDVLLENHAGKSAGASNSAFTAAGVPPAALAGLTAQVRRDGVLLSWHPTSEAQSSTVFRIDRTLLSMHPSAQPASPLAPAPPLIEQTLVVHPPAGVDPGSALDADARFNQQYRYRVIRVATFPLSGHTIELEGQPSDSVIVGTADIFPPAVPRGLQAVADSASGSIDLSWSPDSERDLAGYVVYRRDLATGLPPQRISPPGAPVLNPSFQDTTAQPGHTYAYSVSATDQSSNESGRSQEVEETLPNR